MSEPQHPHQPSQHQHPQQPQAPSPAPAPAQPSYPYPGAAPAGSTNPYAAAPAQNAQNPYGAPPVATPYGGGPAYPGTKAYVEQRFGPVADFGSRAGALLIDVLLSLIGLIPFAIGAVLLVLAVPETDEYGYSVGGTGDGGLAVTGGILMGVGFLLGCAIQFWNRIFRMGRTGQSVGKKVVGLKLISDTTGQPIGALRALGRELIGGLANQVIYLSYLWMLWDDNGQTLADKTVGSTVIRVPKP